MGIKRDTKKAVIDGNSRYLHIVNIKVNKKDESRLMKECKDLYLEHHPEMADIKLSRRFMFKKIVDFYLK